MGATLVGVHGENTFSDKGDLSSEANNSQAWRKLSVQMHHHRAEHWVVVSGSARVRRGSRTFDLQENESTYIP